jgi:uncharacterized repeat protein (TIGR01451 family)
MRRTAWILAALGIAGSTLRGYAQETRASVPVKRTPAVKAPAESASSDFYNDLFAEPPADEPDSSLKPKAGSLAGSTRSVNELLSKGSGDLPAPASAKDAFPGRKSPAASKANVSAAALFEATDRPGTVSRSSKGTTLKADAPNAVPDAGDVVPVAGTGRSVSTSLTNRNQRIEPSKHTAAPTESEVDQLLMVGELPVDPKAPAMPPKTTTPGGSELPELDFSTATEEFEAESRQAAAPATPPAIRKRPAGVAPKFDPNEPPPNWDDEPGDAELLDRADNPFAKFAPGAKLPPAEEEPLPSETAPLPETPSKTRTTKVPAVRKSPLLDDEPIAEAAATAKRPLKNPSTNPLLPSTPPKGTLTIPSMKRPLPPVAADEGLLSDLDLDLDPHAEAPATLDARPEPAFDLPAEPPVVKTARAPRPEHRPLLDLPPVEAQPRMTAEAPRVAAAAAPRQQYVIPAAEKSSGSGVTAEWVKKSEIAIGQECQCELVVKNWTDNAVRDVEVEAYFPANVQLVGTTPSPARAQSSLLWKFDSLNAGETQTIAIRMVPRERGNIATQAYVRFANAASGTFSVAEPMLAVELAGPHEVMIGETASHTVTIRNPGTGTASNVKVEARIPQGLEHSRGSRLMLDLGALNPGESRPVRLALAAVTGGRHVIEVKAHADGDIVQAAASEVVVVAPKLKADIQGPNLRYLGRRAVYTLSVLNDGSASTENVRVMHKIPEGFEYVSSDKGCTYSSSNRMLSWYVGTMNSGETAQAHVTLEARSIGSSTHFIRATSEHGVVADAQVTTRVEGAPSLVVDISDLNDPVETGVETGYEIRVKNEGSAPAERVALTCELPMGAKFVSAAGAVTHAARGQLVEFRPVTQIAPGETVKFQVIIRGEQAGNLRFRTHLTSDSITDPLTSEELTKFYE